MDVSDFEADMVSDPADTTNGDMSTRIECIEFSSHSVLLGSTQALEQREHGRHNCDVEQVICIEGRQQLCENRDGVGFVCGSFELCRTFVGGIDEGAMYVYIKGLGETMDYVPSTHPSDVVVDRGEGVLPNEMQDEQCEDVLAHQDVALVHMAWNNRRLTS